MLEQVRDLREEGNELYELLKTLDEGDWERPTPFKGWTVQDVVAHLHFSDRLAVLSLKSGEAFLKTAEDMVRAAREEEGFDLMSYSRREFGSPKPSELLQLWRDYFMEMCDLLEAADPNARLKWFGPDMGVRMFATARQMETWAHGQDVYDLLRVPRENTDRIKNIAVIGVKTFRWTFVNRGLEVPPDIPYVRLTAPSGEIWEWNERNDDNRVEGLATEFCHVVTQGRNIADTQLEVVGETATKWMAIAQCFAGGPEDPPKPGQRTWGRMPDRASQDPNGR
jgi:uncharacterized protein (TIGR03084 family)